MREIKYELEKELNGPTLSDEEETTYNKARSDLRNLLRKKH